MDNTGSFAKKGKPTWSPTVFNEAHDDVIDDVIQLSQLATCPGLNTYEIQIPYDKHHKVSLLLKCHLNTHSSVKYEVV